MLFGDAKQWVSELTAEVRARSRGASVVPVRGELLGYRLSRAWFSLAPGVLALAVFSVTDVLPGFSARHAVAGTTAAAAELRGLSTQQLAGQRVIYSYLGLTPPASLLARIKAGKAAGVIFYSDNISSEPQIKHVIAELQKAAAHSPVKQPLLMMTDQEGGQVRRLPGAPVLSEKQIGESSHPQAAARKAGRGAGLNLRGVGMDVNLAPVLDVFRKPGDFIDQYQRSYSNNPQTAARLGTDFIEAQQKTGVAATGKHFPGLGAARKNQNTDARPVTLNVSLHSLRTVDEAPYRSGLPAGLRLVMVSWAIYPALDPKRPAGLSPIVVRQELRKRLKFTGVTITDALEAGALARYGGISNRTLLAARAGMDLLLCASQSPSQGTAALNALAGALRNGQLNRSSFMASIKRVLALRSAVNP
ncbi:MAG TPA: glycoside hydrolase family 3 N-terminal domain-containing protein [Solirubrobacteraceae bacterium]|jgi:beta-N-acetylhexosaminidase